MYEKAMMMAEVRKESCWRIDQNEEVGLVSEKDRDGGPLFWLDLVERRWKEI